MFRKDFINSNSTPIITNIIKEEKSITYYYNSSKGDKFKFIFTGPRKETYLSIAQNAFENLIKDNYTLLPNYTLYLTPSHYWDIYKRQDYGKNFLTLTQNVKVYINDTLYRFVDTNYYFNIKTEKLGGVYGIYYQDKLLYIGSSVSDLKARWKEHDINFRNQIGTNKMYHQDFNPNEVEYRTLISAEEICDLIHKDWPSGWLIEYIELIYIKIFQPLYNSEGVSKPFTFKVRKEDLPISHWEIFQNFLKQGDSESTVGTYLCDEK